MARSISPAPGSIKAIQRGTATGDGAIAISTINPSKSVVALYGGQGGNGTSSSTTSVPYVSALSSTQLTVAGATYVPSGVSANLTFSWQIVEYY